MQPHARDLAEGVPRVHDCWFRIGLTPDPQGKTAFVHGDAVGGVPTDLRHC